MPARRIPESEKTMAFLPKPPRREWTVERIAALGTPEVKQLRENAARLGEAEIVERCNAVLSERPRSGVKAAKPATRKAGTRKETVKETAKETAKETGGAE